MISENADIPGVVRITEGVGEPHVVLFGGIHGDEASGVYAIEKLLFDFLGGARTLTRGSLTLARGNELALAAERRYIRHNMNRLFRHDYGAEIDRTSYEFVRAQELKTVLEHCDYFLDLHSAPVAQEPFMVAERNATDFFATLGIPRIITGWSKFSGGAIGGDAENYANAHGAKSATLESGSHYEKRSIDAAYKAATALLSLLGMIAKTEVPAVSHAEIIDMYAVVTKDFDDFRFAGTVENFQFLKKDDVFAFQNGRPLAVLEDSYLLIPMIPDQTKVSEEICYLGRKLAAT